MNFKKSLFSYGVADIFSRAIGLITSPITTRMLSMAQYGAVPLLWAVWTPFSIMQFGGMDYAFPFFKANKENETNIISVITTSTIVAYSAICILWGIFFIVAFSNRWLMNYAGVCKLELFFFSLGLLPAGFIYWLCYLLRFLNRADSYVKITLFGRIAPVVLVIPFLPTISQENRLILSLGVGWVISIMALYFALWEIRKIGIWPFDKQNFSISLSKKMLHYGLFLVPAGALYSLISIVNRLLIGYFLGASSVAILSIGMAIGSIGLMISNWFGLAFDPHLVHWIATGKPSVYMHRLQYLSIVLSIIFSMLAALSCIWSLPIIQFLYPHSYEKSASLVPLLMVVATLSTLSRIAIATVMIEQTPKYHIILYFISLFINCLVSIILIPRLGVIGGIIGTVAAEFSILAGWIFIGVIYLGNLKLSWKCPLVSLTASLIFIYLYKPTSIKSFYDFTLLFMITLAVCLFFLVLIIVGLRGNLKVIFHLGWD